MSGDKDFRDQRWRGFVRCGARWFLLVLTFCGLSSGPAPAFGDEAFDALVEVESRYTELRNSGRYAEALPLAQEMVTRAERDFGNRPAIIGVSMENLAFIYIALNRYDEAEQLYLKSIPIFEKTFGSDHSQVAGSINGLANVYYAQGKFQKAEQSYRQALEAYTKSEGPESLAAALAVHNLAGTQRELGNYRESEQNYRRALAIRTKVTGLENPDAADTLNNLGILLTTQGRYPEAQRLLEQALAVRQVVYNPDHPRIADVLNNLGNLSYYGGRYAQAESYYKRSLAIRRRSLGDAHADVGQSLNNLGMVCFDQSRFAEAEDYYRQALTTRVEALGRDHIVVGDTLANIGNLLVSQGHYDDVEQTYRRAIAIFEKQLAPQHPKVADVLISLGVLYTEQNRHTDAEAANQRALAIYEKAHGPDHPEVARVLHNLAAARRDAGRYDEALQIINRAIDIRDRLGVGEDNRSLSYTVRAKIHWALGHKTEAIADLRRAIELVEQQRGQTSGGEQERGASFEKMSAPFEYMVGWQAELGHPAEAMAALERGRARSLVDQLQTQGIDLLADVPQAEADELRRRDSLAKQQVTSIEKQLELLPTEESLTPVELKQRQQALVEQLSAAQAETVAVYRDIRNTSPAYRLAVSSDFQPLSLAELQQWTTGQEALLLEYMIGQESSHLLIVQATGEARVEKILISDELAKSWSVEPGELTTNKLAKIWQVGDADVVQLLAQPRLKPEASERLAQLWKLLLPADVRTNLVEGKFRRLVIIPDGLLNELPFEALVVETGEEPKFLLDIGPPTIYAPSATVLVNLQQRATGDAPSPQPVLTVADAVYGNTTAEVRPDAEDVLTSRSRYWDGAGPLTELPFTATESSWVARNYKSLGVDVAGLRGAMATEANVRANVEGRELLHFACHGLVDQEHGNFFGALALTPGKAAAGPADDGFLTLPEIYLLPLRRCELSILSACQTNVGPQQRGEGLFGLSRGFLVAGSRRVVASNWLVDDEAAASLVSYFTAGLAQAKKKESNVDYSRSLHDAKRWVRSQAKWQSPYYWATFVQIGPN